MAPQLIANHGLRIMRVANRWLIAVLIFAIAHPAAAQENPPRTYPLLETESSPEAWSIIRLADKPKPLETESSPEAWSIVRLADKPKSPSRDKSPLITVSVGGLEFDQDLDLGTAPLLDIQLLFPVSPRWQTGVELAVARSEFHTVQPIMEPPDGSTPPLPENPTPVSPFPEDPIPTLPLPEDPIPTLPFPENPYPGFPPIPGPGPAKQTRARPDQAAIQAVAPPPVTTTRARDEDVTAWSLHLIGNYYFSPRKRRNLAPFATIGVGLMSVQGIDEGRTVFSPLIGAGVDYMTSGKSGFRFMVKDKIYLRSPVEGRGDVGHNWAAFAGWSYGF